MQLAQLSPKSIVANPSYVNPQVKTDQSTSTPFVNQDAQKTVQATKTDTVTISQQALKMLASDGDAQPQETKESTAEKTTESFRGKA
jgi:hypothetical protein